MDTPTSPPLVFANRVIKQFVDHLVGGKELSNKDYQVIRLIFRKGGGSWSELVNGNIQHLLLLEKVVTVWGKLPAQKGN